jgi:hypothetical protein
MNNNLQFWLEAEQPQMPQAPTSDPNAAGGVGSPPPQQAATPPNPGEDPSAGAEDDVTQDPQSMENPPDAEGGDKDYEQWKHDFMEAAVKADNEELINMLNAIRERNLEASQRKFVEDNFQIFTFRRDANVLKASTLIRNNVKKDLDRTNPGTTLMQHFGEALQEQPLLYQGLIKLAGTFAWKQDLHRKWLASFFGAVQVGGGSTNKDIVFCGDEYDINMSTRFTTQFGEINIGKWNLVESDPKKYLKPDERETLTEGSPEEKQVLRRKIIIKAISETYRKRAFMVHVVTTDGTVYMLGWDIGNSLLDAYKEGKVVVRGQENEDKEILIGDEGEIIPVIDYSLLFVKETGEVDDSGRPETEEVPFIQRRDGTLYLVAELETLKTASAGMSGIFFQSVPYGGNPSDILQLQRSVPGLYEIIAKQVV